MRRAILDGSTMRTREDAHRELREKLELPEYYGNNLDALFDCLSTMKARIEMVHAEEMLEALGIYGERLLETFPDAQKENPELSFNRITLKKAILDGTGMTTREDAHRELREKLELPEYYGNNLDALFDCVSTMRAQVEMTHTESMLEALGIYGERLLETFRDAQKENPYFSFRQI